MIKHVFSLKDAFLLSYDINLGKGSCFPASSFLHVSLNYLDVLAADVQNVRLAVKYKEKTHTIVGPEFGSDEENMIIIARVLRVLKSLVASFREVLAEALRGVGRAPSRADGGAWMRLAIKKKK